MLIDGQMIAVNDDQERGAREQMGLPSGFFLAEATCLLMHDTGNGQVQIPLPPGYVVAAFESAEGKRRYGVVKIEGLRNSL